MGVPNERMREQILRALTRQTPISTDVDFKILAKKTPGFVGADLRDLVDKAGEWSMDQFRYALKCQATEAQAEMEIDTWYAGAIQSIQLLIRRAKDKDAARPSGFETCDLTMQAFLEVLPEIQPSSKREGFATIPDTTWDDIGALQDVREALEMAVVQPIQNPQRYRNVGISAPTGVLLFGPPGCGKTLLAKAVARESKANFISVKGPELLNKVRCHQEHCQWDILNQLSTSASRNVQYAKCSPGPDHRYHASSSSMNWTHSCLVEATVFQKLLRASSTRS
jgi:ribosome biogenesis ATPase